MEYLHYLDEIEPSEVPPGASRPGRDLRSLEARTIEMLKSYVEHLSTREEDDDLLPHVRGALLRSMFALDQMRGVPATDPPSFGATAAADDLAVGSLTT